MQNNIKTLIEILLVKDESKQRHLVVYISKEMINLERILLEIEVNDELTPEDILELNEDKQNLQQNMHNSYIIRSIIAVNNFWLCISQINLRAQIGLTITYW